MEARDPAHTVTVGDGKTIFTPSYGAPYVLGLDGVRRPGSIEDFRNFTKLNHLSPALHMSGGVVCEPMDIPVPKRHLYMTESLLKYSSKPFMGAVTSMERAEDSLHMAGIVFGVVMLSYWVLCGRKLTFWQIWPGTLAFLGVTVLVIPFLSAWFARLVENASALYGALATMIAFLTLLYTTAVLFILTAEINAVRTWHLWPRALFPDWLSHADRKTYAILAPVEERMPEQRVITYFGVLSDRHTRELGPEFDEERFEFVDSPPPFVLDDPDTVLMDYYVEGREPTVVIEPHSPPEP
jgi:hypothetical protein